MTDVPIFRGTLRTGENVIHVEPEPVQLVELDHIAHRLDTLARMLADLRRDVTAATIPDAAASRINEEIRVGRAALLAGHAHAMIAARPYRGSVL